VLFIGVAFLLKYAAEHVTVPIELRLAAVALGGIVLLGFGWRLRASRTGYAMSLQGAAIGILYLTVFAALRLYQLLPASAAFGLLFWIAALSSFLAGATGRDGACRARHRRRFRGTDPDVDRRRQPRDAVRLFRRAECGHLRDRVVQGVATAEHRGLRVHVRRRHAVGRNPLPARGLRDDGSRS
jgi:hypothetical protein